MLSGCSISLLFEHALPFEKRKRILMSIAFGTSGLRGPADGFTAQQVFGYVGAFLARQDDGEKTIYVGADLRDSSPTIARLCVDAVRRQGWQAIYAGNVPTPALAAFAMGQNCPALMITGSHIPETYNGIKFYRRDGELLKSDEDPMRLKAQELVASYASDDDLVSLPEVDARVARAYVDRYIGAFGPEALSGLRVGVDMHSAVGRDLLVEILSGLGATCFPFRRVARFIAVDTEALEPADLERALSEIGANDLDCVVSTDGDGDRPLLIGRDGSQINGDVLGALTAQALGIATIVTPLSSTSAIEMSGWFEEVVRTRIGSPYVVAAMAASGGATVAGFEANGGFLLGTKMQLAFGALDALPTRDAVLPLVMPLIAARVHGNDLAKLVATLPQRVMRADRLRNVPADKAAVFLAGVAAQAENRVQIDPILAQPLSIDLTDGVRMILEDDVSVHLRQSGNAPEMRAYVETNSGAQTGQLLETIMARLGALLH
jgi:phosphomannomutase